MLFQTEITIPANTAETAPTKVKMDIARGVISKFMVRPRPGHSGLAHCVILHHNHQIAPSTPGMSFAGDTFPIDWEDYYECYEPPHELEVHGWNESTTYEHSFDIFIAILPRKGILATSVTDTIKGVVGLITPRKVT